MKNAIILLALAAATLGGVQGFHQAEADRLARMVDAAHSDNRQDSRIAGVELYVKPQPHPLRAGYPELFQGKAVILTFTAAWCPACRQQEAVLARSASGYQTVKAAIDEAPENGRDRSEPKWQTLMNKWDLGTAIPVTVIVVKGEPIKVFTGLTPWEKIEPHAAPAKIKPAAGHLTDSRKTGPFRELLRRIFVGPEPDPGADFQAWLAAAWEWLQANWVTVLKIVLSLLVFL